MLNDCVIHHFGVNVKGVYCMAKGILLMLREDDCIVSMSNLFEGLTGSSQSFRVKGKGNIEAFLATGRKLGFMLREDGLTPAGRRVMVAFPPRGLSTEAEHDLTQRWFGSVGRPTTESTPTNNAANADAANVWN